MSAKAAHRVWFHHGWAGWLRSEEEDCFFEAARYVAPEFRCHAEEANTMTEVPGHEVRMDESSAVCLSEKGRASCCRVILFRVRSVGPECPYCLQYPAVTQRGHCRLRVVY